MRVRDPRLVSALCWTVLVLEGYDVVMFGTIVPSLLKVEGWHLDRAGVGLLGSIAILGMLVGAPAAGFLGDRLGRRPVLISSVVVFSAGMGVGALAPNPVVFGAGRLIVGLGAGILLPTAVALIAEYAPPERRHRNQGVVFSGIGVGGAISGLLALVLVTDGGFRGMLAVGVLPALVLVPVLLRLLPESEAYLRANTTEAAAAAPSWRVLLKAPYTVRTLLFWVVTFLSLLMLFGAYTWLPVMMTQAGYSLGPALAFLLVLNVGVALGAVACSGLADRFGVRRVITASFAAAAAAFALLVLHPPAVVGYPLIAVVGAGAIGTQVLVNSFVAAVHPVALRARAVGIALGVGRIGGVLGPLYGGWLLARDPSADLGFYGFAVTAVIAGLVILGIHDPLSAAAPAWRQPAPPAEELSAG